MATLTWPLGAALAGLITLATIALWWFAAAAHRRWDAAISAAPWQARAPLRFGTMQLFGTGWVRGLMRLANNVGYLLLRVLMVVLWLFLVVLVLPVWDALPSALYDFLAATLASMRVGFVAYLPKLGRIIVILVVVRLVLAMLKLLFDGLARGQIRWHSFDRSWARQTHTLARMAIIVLAAILIFPLLPGSGTTGFQGIAIFIGALISIGASTAVGNAVAGVVLTYTKAFQRGDRVRIHDTVGDVTARATFVTRIRTIMNEEIAIPNQLVLAGPIINYSRDAGGNGVAVSVRIGLGYDVPWREAHRLLKEAAVGEGVMEDPAPRVYQEELGDFAVGYTLHAFVEDPKSMLGVRSRIVERTLDLFAAAKIEILSPDHITWREGHPVLPAAAPPRVPPTAEEVTPDVPADETLPPPEDPADLDPIEGDDILPDAGAPGDGPAGAPPGAPA